MVKNDLPKIREENRLLTIILLTYFVSVTSIYLFGYPKLSSFLLFVNVIVIIYYLVTSQGKHTVKLIISLILALLLFFLHVFFLIAHLMPIH
ncbi:hypothetical protein [Streptococcus uberis]|uniref:hypothetical protein n=1 Tax=Streptococcus uberis TaxID=1349 RepID=UPI000B10C1B8|nr:hypothetical protein [Streptococcus uberis]